MLKAMLNDGMFHSDEKPQNLVLDTSDELAESFNFAIYLIDFGLSTMTFDEIPIGFSKFYAPYEVVKMLK